MRTGNHDHGRVGGHLALLSNHQARDRVVVTAEGGRDGGVAEAVGPRGIALPVPLREVDLLFLAGHYLDQCVGNVLFFGVCDPLRPIFVRR